MESSRFYQPKKKKKDTHFRILNSIDIFFFQDLEFNEGQEAKAEQIHENRYIPIKGVGQSKGSLREKHNWVRHKN